jgi:bifunctional UDP-N-acetylglucosamine pyrophosphorylase/glucosamine-1-phosphate N-acetyltransferase
MALQTARAVVLAAGKSTRFKTKKSKLLSSICGQAMILYPLRAIESLGMPMTVILGHQAEVVQAEISAAGVQNASFIVQKEQLGTGHAVLCSKDSWGDAENIVILYGDMPLMNKEVLQYMLDDHTTSGAALTFCTSYVLDPHGYGRVIEREGVLEIIEEKNCTDEQRLVSRINAGVYVMKRTFLEEYIEKVDKNPLTGEIYLTDLVALASKNNLGVKALSIPYDNVRGVNTLQELWGVEQIKRSEFIKFWMARGVRFELAQSIHIDINVEIGAGSFIGTGVHLLGNTKIGEECFIGAFTIIEDSIVGNESNVHSHSVVQHTVMGSNVHVGPFARLRQNVTLGNDVQIGNFVEIKTAVIGAETKMKHLAYIGDATIGKEVNIGAGSVTCNYDGVQKNVTVIEDGAFVGSNNTLIAPLTIGENSYTAAGSVVNRDVPPEALAIGRTRQENKPGYAKKLRDESSRHANGHPIEKMDAILHDDHRMQFRGAIKDADQKVEFE